MKRKLLSECLSIAIKNNHKHPEGDCYHHFSFVIQDNKIISTGVNRKSHPFTYLGFKSYSKLHSEVDAFYKAKGIMDKDVKFEVVNIRLFRLSDILLSINGDTYGTLRNYFNYRRRN